MVSSYNLFVEMSTSGGAKFKVVFRLKEPELKTTCPLFVAFNSIIPPDELIKTPPEVDNIAWSLLNTNIEPILSSDTDVSILSSPEAPIDIAPVDASIKKYPLEESNWKLEDVSIIIEPLDSKTTPLPSNFKFTPDVSTKNVALLTSIVLLVFIDKNPPDTCLINAVGEFNLLVLISSPPLKNAILLVSLLASNTMPFLSFVWLIMLLINPLLDSTVKISVTLETSHETWKIVLGSTILIPILDISPAINAWLVSDTNTELKSTNDASLVGSVEKKNILWLTYAFWFINISAKAVILFPDCILFPEKILFPAVKSTVTSKLPLKNWLVGLLLRETNWSAINVPVLITLKLFTFATPPNFFHSLLFPDIIFIYI